MAILSIVFILANMFNCAVSFPGVQCKGSATKGRLGHAMAIKILTSIMKPGLMISSRATQKD